MAIHAAYWFGQSYKREGCFPEGACSQCMFHALSRRYGYVQAPQT